MREDYYKTLGIDKTATQDEIKKAFRKLAHQHHPDKGGNEKEFAKVSEAYQVLGDKQRRTQYDQVGSSFNGQGFDFGNFSGQDFDAGNLGDIFEDMFGFNRKKKTNFRKGDDLQLDIKLGLQEVLEDQEKTFTIERFKECQRCEGSGAEPNTKVKECSTCRGQGQVQQVQRTVFGTISHSSVCPECKGEGNIPESPCNVCKGEGRIKEKDEIVVNIPAGVDSGQVVRIQGKGNAGKKKGIPGDLYIRIIISKHPKFERKGDDLFTDLNIPYSKLVLGGEIEIPTLDKEKRTILKIPSNTKTGKVFKISNKGVPRYSSIGKGNLYVKIEVRTPDRLTKSQKKVLKILQEEGL